MDGVEYKGDQIVTPQGQRPWEFAPKSPKNIYPSKTQHGTDHPQDCDIAIADVQKIESSADIIILSRGQINSLITDYDLKAMTERGIIKYLRNNGEPTKTIGVLKSCSVSAK